MPKKIIRPAYFKLCGKNQEFGKIVFSDKSSGKFVATKLDAWEELSNSLNKGRLTEEEAIVVAQQIDKSSLPMHDLEEKVALVYANAINIHVVESKSKKRWVSKNHPPKDRGECSFSE